jgi:hypothetical protein
MVAKWVGRGGVRRLVAVCICLAVGLLGAAGPAVAQSYGSPPTVAQSSGSPPGVVPALRQWSGTSGTFQLGPQSRIVVDASSLSGEGAQLRDDIAAVTGLTMPVVVREKPSPGDMSLSASGTDAQLGSEGYRLTIGDHVDITADADAGVFYGGQTVLQMLRVAAGHRTLPRGTARDWPQQRERGFLLDAGRKYYSPDFIVQTIREMSYLKLNTLQLHLSDDNAFRLVSERFPYLAAPQAYTRADIARFEAAAHTYHVTIIPEIEMPAHAGAIISARPDLGFACPAMGNQTLDVTKPEVRQFTTDLINEFAPLFSGPEFHIATDEYPDEATMDRCPELVTYAKSHGFASTADVFVDFINQMNQVVRAHGKRMVIWNWWDVNKNPTIAPDKTIKVEAWTTAAETGQDHSAAKYLSLGYEVVASPSDTLYVTPGFPLLPDPQSLYEQWQPIVNPHLDGYLISVWSNSRETAPDAYFDAYLRRPREVLADRLWGGPREGTYADFIARADAIGTPPGVPDYTTPNKLTGTPYGTSPGYEPTSTFDKAFDGDPITYFLNAQPDGGYTGIDLGAGHESAVSLVRFFATPGDQNLPRLVGGRFEGCTDGPASGCHTLATINDPPSLGWNELAISDSGHYRWLRYVGPPGGYSSVAEIEFIAPNPALTVQAPSTLRQLGNNRAVTTYRNTGTKAVHDVRLDLTAFATDNRVARRVRPLDQSRFPVVQPGMSVSTTWQVDVPFSAATGRYELVGRADSPDTETAGIARSTLGPALDANFDPGFIGLDKGQSRDTKLVLANHAGQAVTIAWHDVRFPDASPGFTLTPADGTITVPAGGTASATLTATAAADATSASPFPVYLTASAAGQPETPAGSVKLGVLWYPGAQPSLGATYNNTGITDNSNTTPGNFDLVGDSYSAQGLVAAGLAPGATVSHDGLTFTWPDVPPGSPDNTVCDSQVIAISGSGSKLGFLGGAAFGTQTGTVYITYTDGSTDQAQLSFGDWYGVSPAPGTDTVATVPWNIQPGPPNPAQVSVYYGSIPLNPAKTVRFVTLPSSMETNGNLHVFAMAIG